MNQGRLCVLGSLNVDLTVTMERFHQPGETVTGTRFMTFPGGKGGNQAVAAARLGAQVCMVACVGEDDYGRMYLRVLKEEGVDTARVRSFAGQETGVALIEVDSAGENRIVVVPGANRLLSCDLVSEAEDALAACAHLLMQLESPIESVTHAAALMRRHGGRVILDPAPARPLPDALLCLADFLTPNETELAALTGLPVEDEEDAARACRALLDRGVGAVVNKRGARGALLVTREGALRIPGFKVQAVDTTAAGDTFNAGFAVGLSMGMPMTDAIRLANAAAALSTTCMGAQGAMPSLDAALSLAR